MSFIDARSGQEGAKAIPSNPSNGGRKMLENELLSRAGSSAQMTRELKHTK